MRGEAATALPGRRGICFRLLLAVTVGILVWSVLASEPDTTRRPGLAPTIDFIYRKPPSEAPAAPPSLETPVGQGGAWDLVFNDEFDGPSLNTSRWHTCFWWSSTTCSIESNHELELYTPDDVLVQSGMLRLRAQRRQMTAWNGATYQYTSGMVTTGGRRNEKPPGFTFTYGYAEARIRVPRGVGLWSAFWLLPVNYQSRPEIDIMEMIGLNTDEQNMNYHYLKTDGSPGDEGSTWVGPDLANEWHVFGVDWQPDAIVWYVDGVERWRYTDRATISREPSYLLLNLAVGGDWPGSPNASTPFPSTLDVDYMRVWKHTAPGPAPRVPDLTASMRAEAADGFSDRLVAGANATYTVTVTNAPDAGTTTGPVSVAGELPSGLRFVSASGDGWTCTASGQNVSCTNPGALNPGESSDLSLVVQVASDAPASLTHTIEVSTANEVAQQNNRATVTTSVASGCQARPPMTITVTRVSAGKLEADVSVTTNSAVTSNALQSIALGGTTNAVVDVVGGESGLKAPARVTLPDGTQSAKLVVRRADRGAYTVRLVLSDRCGDWSTFVGEGS